MTPLGALGPGPRTPLEYRAAVEYDDPLANLKSLIEQAEKYIAAKDWPFVGHVLTQAAMECMVLAEKAQDGGHALDPDHDPEGGT